MARKGGVRRIRVKVEENVTQRLRAVGLGMSSPLLITEMQRGAEIMAASARQRAPMGSTGNLRKGIYTASAQKNNAPALTRPGGGRIMEPLRFPPTRRQVVIVSGVYYGFWIERGRKARSRDQRKASAHERRGVGRTRRRPFFRSGLKAAQPTAQAFIQRRLERLIMQRWTQGR